MAPLHRLAGGLRALFGKDRAERDLDEELRTYLETAIERKMTAGLTREAATRAARVELGSLAAAKDYVRDAGWESRVESVWLDARYAIRALRKAPGFAAVAIFTLALGIGANTAIFSVVNAVLLKPLPYSDANRFVSLAWEVPAEFSPTRAPVRSQTGVSAFEMNEIRTRTSTLTHIGTLSFSLMALSRENAPRLQGARVSASLLELLHVPPLHGRLLTAADEAPGAPPAILIGYSAWRRHFGASPDVVGQLVTLENALGPRRQSVYTVIGVMPRGFEFPTSQPQFWMPPEPLSAEDTVRRRSTILARLADGVSVQAATAEVNGALRSVRSDERVGGNATYRLVPREDVAITALGPALLLLVAAVAVVLLIACTNVANLLLARGAGRRREIAVRAAVGADRARLIRQALTESLVLALLGAAGGIVLAFGGISLLRRLADTTARIDLGIGLAFPRLDEVGLELPVLAFTMAIAVVTGVLFGLGPALRHSRTAGHETFKAGAATSDLTFGGAASGAGSTLVSAEIGMAMLLLASGALLMHSFVKLSSVDPGFEPDGVVTFQVSLPLDRYADDERLEEFAETLVERIRAMPGVESAAYGRTLPMVQLQDGQQLRRTRTLPSQAAILGSDIGLVSRDYVRTMRMRIVHGRSFDDRESRGRPRSVIVNEALAARYFVGENPVGQTIYIGVESAPWEIVGVVANVRQLGLDREPEPQLVVDFRQWTEARIPRVPLGPYFAARTDADIEAVLPAFRGLVHELESSATLFNIAPMNQLVATTLDRRRMYSVLLGVFAGVGVSLSLIGVYGVVAYSVTRRTREIGIRVALGARRSEVIRLVLRQAMRATTVGIVLGLFGALAVTRYLEGMLFGLTPHDPATFIAVSLLFVVVAALAAFVPARRAATVSPLVALRCE